MRNLNRLKPAFIRAFLMLCFIAFSNVFAQNRIISEKVYDLTSKGANFEKVDLFTRNNSESLEAKFSTSLSEVTVLDLNKEYLKKILNESPEFITVGIPYQNEIIPVQLYLSNKYQRNINIIDQDGNPVEYQEGKYYRGVVEGDYSSLAAISFFNDNVMGVISTMDLGNIVIGKSVGGTEFISYADTDILDEIPFECDFDDSLYDDSTITGDLPENTVIFENETFGCAGIYYELGYEIYEGLGYDMQNVLDWITGVHNNVEALYLNDNLHITLSSVKVWTEPDPYIGDFSQNYDMFSNNIADGFDGDLGHLIKLTGTISKAGFDGLCDINNLAFSVANLSYENIPLFSTTVYIIAHEMGHVFGSKHTHACLWNGDNTAIDGCGTALGSTGCEGPFPEDGGTIMSYCNRIEGVGVNFAKGFGSQPLFMINSSLNQKNCLTGQCEVPESYICEFEVVDIVAPITYFELGGMTNSSSHELGSSSEIEYFLFSEIYLVPDMDYELLLKGNTNGNQVSYFTVWTDWNQNGIFEEEERLEIGTIENSDGIDDKILLSGVFNVPEDVEFGIMKLLVVKSDLDYAETPCSAVSSGQAELYYINILEGYYYLKLDTNMVEGGQIFGEGVKYTNSLVTISALPNDHHYFVGWYNTNDEDVSGLQFYDFVITENTHLIAKFSSGSIIQNLYGITMKVYPNPVDNILYVKSEGFKIISLELYDLYGRRVKRFDDIDSYETELNLKELPSGIYILKAINGVYEKTIKVIKK